MKINSHLLGFLVGGAIIGIWLWQADKELEKFQGWTIWKSGGKIKVEYLINTKDQNPSFATVEEAKAWITAKVLMTKIPWGQ